MLKYQQFGFAVFGAALYAIGLGSVLVANGFSEGGFAGLSALLHFLFNTSLGITYFIINIPLLLIGARYIGFSFLIKTIIGIILVSSFLLVSEWFHISLGHELIVCFVAGMMSGVGRGLMFRNGYTTGGFDIIAFMLNRAWNVPKAYAIFSFDLFVMLLFAIFIDVHTALYSLLALYIGSRWLHTVVEFERTQRSRQRS